MIILLVDTEHLADPVGSRLCLRRAQEHYNTMSEAKQCRSQGPFKKKLKKISDQLVFFPLRHYGDAYVTYITVQVGKGIAIYDHFYLLSPSKCVIEAGHIGHDGSLIRLWGVDDICGV